jgi:FAD/FMN-containing dehydrogenase
MFQQKTGAMSRGPADQTAFGHRSEPYAFVVFSGWDDPDQTEANISWTRQLVGELEPYSAGGEYVNELGPDDPEANIRASFGANYDRLAELKKRYDPTNLFRHTQNIKPVE